MSSTELFDAASISMTSSEVALAIATHESHDAAGLDRRARARSSGTRRGSSPSTSCRSRASRRTGRRGGPCPARRRCAACARRAPGRRRRRRCAGGGGGRARGRRTRATSVASLPARPRRRPRALSVRGRCDAPDRPRTRPSARSCIWLVVGRGLVNYDTLYSLVWGRDLAHGRVPDYDVALAPTPHPLATLGGVVLSPLSSRGARRRARRGGGRG